MASWCQGRGIVVGGLLTPETAWRLAVEWYHDRLDPGWCRKTLEQAQALFTALGMTGSFWQLHL